MFKKILIANRGEIAVRIMATCREMDIRSVAVYSDADQHARHVLLADEAYPIGPAPATQSYLNIPAILAVARESGAEAIHPGYGFLSENAEFAEACEQAGIVFIGPSASAMRLMGSKIAAKHIARDVQAPTVPGYNGESQDQAVLQQEALRIGFPLLIKASAGGGGKGMRVVENEAEFLSQLAGAQREALAAFGDGTVFLERYLQQPRHIEIQILADTHGNVVHLGERECSIQRRHQKIVEESPSIALTPALREQMGAVAIRIARAANYVNAGTLEFMLDTDQQFYFLEMNTRLQVEHPVTELVTGLDLVRQQLRIAAGEPLELRQEELTPRGHAIEVRLYAEDPQQQFLPSTGLITSFIQPVGPGVRLDSGVVAGDEVTQYYDPMLAKLIVYAEQRPAAIARMRAALERCAIFGVTTNISLLHAISLHPAFSAGETPTNFLALHHMPATRTSVELPDDIVLAAAIMDIQQDIQTAEHSMHTQNPWQSLGPWRTTGGGRTLTYTYQEQEYRVVIRPTTQRQESWLISINQAEAREVTALAANDNLLIIKTQHSQRTVYVQIQEHEVQLFMAGQVYHLLRTRPPEIASAAHGSSGLQKQKSLTAPMAGTIVKVQAQEGDIVEAQQVLLILSAMKMEHAITAPYAGKIQRIHYKEGAVVQGGALVVEMAEEE
ncbi:3-methylcrotonoyl-CoA carboxylase subunit alpha [Dictyobacter alpinus]|uniref:Biotin-dependent 3-methylcrotonyl-coenzyme A carboxylase alpha1 subunit n=1 Tax=Dictyobacter alpinus TaxID=2014873 RepID=A0A402B0X1_9CHLR|nr:acetyl/propionyl/methylcrotonyl-CoA carboxylase subunit alpha [Dictyobacter alpinus]GCE25001.1 3-methylcrotonoyl-CoA carboxylase subunit alpha [Dictyobacter alpinus]